MARPIRVEFEGAVYHVTARGNERRLIFRDFEDRKLFLAALEQCVDQHGLRVHGYCLMGNHYHLLVETPRGNLSRAIGWLQTTYTIRFNRRHRRSGHLFQGRFKAHLVEADSYAMELIRYVHLNPVRPKNKSASVPAERREALREYRWSSHQSYTGQTSAPGWLCLDWLSYFGRTRRAAQREYEQFIESAFESVVECPWESLRMGLVLGGDALLERASGLLQAKTGTEEVEWVARTESAMHRKAVAATLAGEQSERCWKAWVFARLGGERSIDIARTLGYKDGSAITHLLKRLDTNQSNAPAFAQRVSTLTREFERELSR
ncbi:MAG: transposase [Verrucomicrobiota bacterium]